MTSNGENPLRRLGSYGQSPWLDFIRRGLLASGELAEWIERDGIKGVTSNPAIFEKAISGSTDYDAALSELRTSKLSPSEIYERLAVSDIQATADVLKGVYESEKGQDGFVSLEVSPYLANDTDRTLAEARRLWRAVDRPNVMIKVPATEAGLPAIERLVSEGVNVNITLLFSRAVYERVIEAYVAGLEKRLAAGEDVSSIASVASFFVSRIDVAVDDRLRAKIDETDDERHRERLSGLLGTAAIDNAKLAYEIFEKRFAGERWAALEAKGAHKQRLLWASTGTKNPEHSDVRYVEALIGPMTVSTIPLDTLNAYRDHGRPAPRLQEGWDEARRRLEELERAGISLDAVTDELTEEGVRKFVEPFDKLLAALDDRCRKGAETKVSRGEFLFPTGFEEQVREELSDWQASGKVRRLWERDASLWTGEDEGEWLGWLGLTEDAQETSAPYRQFAERIRREGFRDVVVLGMGGSSLCPELFGLTFEAREGFPRLSVLDSTDPAEVLTLERRLTLEATLFVVSSKSGKTLEPNIFLEHFHRRVTETVGGAKAGGHFVAVTDPGSPLEKTARERRFRRVFHGVPSVGGRYSALSSFGLAPAAAMGLDVAELLERADRMAVASSSCIPAGENPAVRLGVALGVAAREGRNKLTFVLSPALRHLGAWLEQLVAESTGKQSKAILPVDGETLGAPEVYGPDRLFVHVRLATDGDASLDRKVQAIADAGHPVVRIGVDEILDLGQELFRWELATAVAGAVMGINPFDQPDVEASKIATRELTEAFESTGRLPEESAFFEEEGIRLFADERNVEALRSGLGTEPARLADVLRAHLNRLEPGDYFALLAYVERNEENERVLQSLRNAVRDRIRVATCLGFGPRFLHSTGQAYKGGPPSGVFLQITSDDGEDVPVPGHAYSFGTVKAAQARGDFEVLSERRRRALRAHVGANVSRDLQRIEAAVREALT